MGLPPPPPSASFPVSPMRRFSMCVTVAVTMVTVVALVTPVSGFPYGAPQYVCVSMRPSHPYREQTYSPSTFPFDIGVKVKGGNEVVVTPGSDVIVTIRSKRLGQAFQGLLVTVVDSSGRTVSGLTVPAGQPLKLLDCTRSRVTVAASGLTHSRRLDTETVSFGWHVPDMARQGDVFDIRVTVVQSVDVYWVGVNNTLTLAHPAPTPTPNLHQEVTSFNNTRPTSPRNSDDPTSSASSLSRLSSTLKHQTQLVSRHYADDRKRLWDL
ncbi:putative defense protein 3 [Babylonia areolata]|uniref:putative defense protein 3 n=1 Tax=Babylonia areolata TaxID=304850 RepID=UPI003FD68600